MMNELKRYQIKGIVGAILMIVGAMGLNLPGNDEELFYELLWFLVFTIIGANLLYKYIVVLFENPMDSWKRSKSRDDQTQSTENKQLEKNMDTHNAEPSLIRTLCSSRLVGQLLVLAALPFWYLATIELIQPMYKYVGWILFIVGISIIARRMRLNSE